MAGFGRKKRNFTKEVDGVTWISISDAADRISRGRQQILRWCAFWEQTNDEVRQQFKHPLPEYRQDLDGYGTRYFREDDLDQLRKFRDQVKVYGFFSKIDNETWKKVKSN